MSISAILDYRKMYRLDDPMANRPLRLGVLKYNDWVTNELAWELFRGKYSLNLPLKLGFQRGGQPTSFLWSSFPPIVCVSTGVVELLSANEVTGWATYPVEVYGRKGELLSGYHGLAVTGSECKRDRSRSEILTRQAVPGGEPFQVYKGLYFDEADWDGSDIFLICNHGIIVTQRVRNLLKKSKITNVQLIPLTEVEIDVYLDQFEHNK